MGASRFFALGPVPESGTLPLSADDVHHLRDVLRLGAGDTIEVVGDGAAWTVRLEQVADTVRGVREGVVPPFAPLPHVTLAQGLAKGEKMDTVVRQATELGVERIVPFSSARSVVKLDALKAAARTDRWRRIAQGAAKQAHRLDVPQIVEMLSLDELPEALSGTTMLVAWEDASDAPGVEAALATSGSPDAQVSVIVGPEGGLSAPEIALLESAGAVRVSLGPMILRTETAGVIATALAIHALGGLGASRG
ncbi:MAG: 16S rRNA (uracil(1498)-N(3))-methyltransferase [Coriobacteriia bacterium]|nr:16S rRNA (uracil(1498)-N(3))-methyltransferase [Coriobacteriia bacterium]